MMGSIAVITDLAPVYSCHSSKRVIRVKNVPEQNMLNTVWGEPQDYTDLHEISVLILCNLVVLYADICTILNKYPEHAIELPSGSRMTRLNKSHELNDGSEVLR